MPRPRFNRLEPAKRQRLLETAATEFACHGYDRASLNRMILSCGLSKGSFYYYFDDKADLFATVSEAALNRLLPMEPFDIGALETDTYWPELMQLFLETLGRARTHPWISGVAKIMYQSPTGGELDEGIQETYRATRFWVERVLQRGQALGTVRSDLPESLLVAVVLSALEAADRWMVEYWDELDGAEVDSLAHEIFGLLQRLVEPKAGVPDVG